MRLSNTVRRCTRQSADCARQPVVYFLNKFANAWRALVGAPEDVSRSTTLRGANSSHSFRLPLFATRAVIGFRHSKCAAGSKETHARQVCRSALHFGQVLSKSITTWTVALQAGHFTLSPKAIIFGERGPSRSRGGDCCCLGCDERAGSRSLSWSM
jgi:hypothetical protein